MIKYSWLLVITGLVVIALVAPRFDQPTPGETPAFASPLFAVCPVEEGSGRTTEIAALSTVEGPVQLTLFASGATAGTIGVSTGSTGSTVIPVIDVAAVGTVGGLVELPAGTSAAGSSVRGAATLAVERCVSSIPPQVFVTGGVTAGQREFTLHLMNPFAGEAVVSLMVSSEVGLESNPRYESVIVPARGSTVLAFSQLAPGRERLSVLIDTSQGRVIAAARQSGPVDGALWNALPPATDWFVPYPVGDLSKRVLIGNPTNSGVEYQVDLYGPGGFEAAAVSGTIGAFGQEILDLSEFSDARAVRVISATPVVATLWIETGSALAVTAGANEPAGSWLIPAALVPGVETGRLILLNPGLEDATVTLRSLRDSPSQVTLTVGAESVVEVALDAADGYLVDSASPVVALLTLLGEEVGAAAIGVPLDDG